MSYLLDANVFIQARNLHYGFDICPGFWDWIDQAHDDGTVLSIRQVRDELTDNELSTWASTRQTLFPQLGSGVTASLGQLSTWATTAGYEPAAVNTFFQGADYFIIAAALAGGHTVVTHEVASNSLKKIKIPNACLGVGVHFMNPYTMLRIEKAKFVLEVA